ncbi:MAG: hypothetical protein KL839_19405 [Rhizobium sp.]|nr:hypothetical protein [Rhizobium sp.]
MDIEDVMKALAQAYWGRPAVDPELVAMVGELRRDSAAIAAAPEGRNGALFNIEPAAFDRILQMEADR